MLLGCFAGAARLHVRTFNSILFFGLVSCYAGQILISLCKILAMLHVSTLHCVCMQGDAIIASCDDMVAAKVVTCRYYVLAHLALSCLQHWLMPTDVDTSLNHGWGVASVCGA